MSFDAIHDANVSFLYNSFHKSYQYYFMRAKFYAKRWGNNVHCTSVFIFSSSWEFLFRLISFFVYLIYKNFLKTQSDRIGIISKHCLMGRVFASGPGDQGSIPGGVIPKNKKKCYLIPPQHYKINILGKVEQSRQISRAFSYTSAKYLFKRD